MALLICLEIPLDEYHALACAQLVESVYVCLYYYHYSAEQISKRFSCNCIHTGAFAFLNIPSQTVKMRQKSLEWNLIH